MFCQSMCISSNKDTKINHSFIDRPHGSQPLEEFRDNIEGQWLQDLNNDTCGFKESNSKSML